MTDLLENNQKKLLAGYITGIAIFDGNWLTPGRYFSFTYYSDISNSPKEIDISPAGSSFEENFENTNEKLIRKALEDAGYAADMDSGKSFEVINLKSDELIDFFDPNLEKRMSCSPLIIIGGGERFKVAIIIERFGESAISKRRYAKLLGGTITKDWVQQVCQLGCDWVISQTFPDSNRIIHTTTQAACALDVVSTTGSENLNTSSLFFKNFLRIVLGLFYSALPASGINEVRHDIHPFFYINIFSKSWLKTCYDKKRIASLVWGKSDDRMVIQFEECDHPQSISVINQIKNPARPQLYLSAGSNPDELIDRINQMKSRLIAGNSLEAIANKEYEHYLGNPDYPYVISIIASSKVELEREIDFALKGVLSAFDKKGEWQSPAGSYFASNPLGKDTPVAFVYPGAFNSYTWMAKDLFFLFPNLYERFSRITSDMAGAIQERLVYPRVQKVTPGMKLSDFDVQLMNDAIAMLTSGTALSFLFTAILTDYFHVCPKMSFGYSLGETSMMFASGVWSDGDNAQKKLEKSPLFQTKLAGPLTTIKEYWLKRGLLIDRSLPVRWGNYVLMCDPDQIIERLNQYNKVYLTHINTARQVVIGGDPDQCQKLIQDISCSYLLAPFAYALHCEPIVTEYRTFIELFTWKVAKIPDQVLYSAASYRPIQFDSRYIAAAISRTLCNRLDFPRLIQKVYQDGARCFIELGAGSNCAKWIDETLKGLPHISIAINRKGLDDYSSLLRVIGRIVSNRMRVNIDVLFTTK